MGHTGGVFGVAIDPQGVTAYTASGDKVSVCARVRLISVCMCGE